jgi:hypothetical protein
LELCHQTTSAESVENGQLFIYGSLAEFSAYYSNRMSYDEVAGLLERVTGQPVLSDQTIQHLVVAKAVEVSRQWQNECQADTAAPPLPAVRPQVDWYDPQSEEVLLLTDAMQVKQQKAHRGQGADTPTVERETKRVHTDVWLVEQPTCVLDTFFCLGWFGSYRRLWPHNTIHFGEVH